jgi:hypothetical protein
VVAICADGSYHKFFYDKKDKTSNRDNYQMFMDLEKNGGVE